jgi:hypothetical protein
MSILLAKVSLESYNMKIGPIHIMTTKTLNARLHDVESRTRRMSEGQATKLLRDNVVLSRILQSVPTKYIKGKF